MARKLTGNDVFDEALRRMIDLYSEGHRVVVTFSGGKDSTVCLELAILAAEATGNLPVDVVMRDEEIMFPGTFEYCARVAEREEVNFLWAIAGQPVLNVMNRPSPYFWVFDPECPELWVRQPPEMATYIEEKDIDHLVTPKRYLTPEGKKLFAVIGLRVSESRIRRAGLMSSGGYRTRTKSSGGHYNARPIYDWVDADVWKAIGDLKWDYNTAYDTMMRMGVPLQAQRIAPPTMSHHSIPNLQVASRAWPRWFSRVAARLDGVRTAAMFGKRAVSAHRKHGESWEECFKRQCIDEAPAEWIATRCTYVMHEAMAYHAKHSTGPLPQVSGCRLCNPGICSWKHLAQHLYNGDPFGTRIGWMHRSDDPACKVYLEPEFFRPGAGTWGGKPSW
jgi:predicted phosphoadenosine phosphosulfate sulfurtransferase